MKQTIYLILVTLVSGVLTSVWAQEDQIVTGINLVSVNVLVTDRSGKYVKGLNSAQFEVFDEKVKQQIAHFSDEPLQSRSGSYARYTIRHRQKRGRCLPH